MERKTETITKEYFVAADGRQFDSESACLAYEERLEKRQKCLDLLETKRLGFNVIPIEALSEFDEYESTIGWYKVNDQNELDDLMDAFEIAYDQSLDRKYIDKPTTVCLVSYSEYHECGEIVTKEEAVRMAELYLKWYEEI